MNEETIAILKLIASRLKSRVAVASLISLIVFILKTYYNIEIPQVDKLTDLILVGMSAFGILNDPTNPKGF